MKNNRMNFWVRTIAATAMALMVTTAGVPALDMYLTNNGINEESGVVAVAANDLMEGIKDSLVTEAQAAVAWPGVGSTATLEMVAQGTINGYTTTSLSKRGTCSPSKAYNAYAEKGDVISILQVTSSYVKFEYPTSSGKRIAYGKPSEVFGVTAPAKKLTSYGSATIYKYAGSSSYGSIANNDTIYSLRTSGSYTFVIYTAKSGNRAWKAGWVNTNTLNKITTKGTLTNLSYGLYKNTSARISCGFDGYTSTSGRHEGIDIVCGVGKPVYSLTSGVVTRVYKGRTGSGGLSTIAIYNAETNKTVIYLHSAPLSLSAGQSISKGQQIATESWRGCSSSSGAHTHVEVRDGKQSYASKSVGDSVLDNSNPTSFWNGQGYAIK